MKTSKQKSHQEKDKSKHIQSADMTMILPDWNMSDSIPDRFFR